MNNYNPIVAIVGRPNVGKSTMYNRFIGKKHAIVNDLPGVTRDYRESEMSHDDVKFNLIDTAGLEYKDKDILSQAIFAKSEKAIEIADLVLFVVDARVGVTSEDRKYAKWIRKKDKKILLVINKAESNKLSDNISEFYSLGFDERICVSSEHGEGMVELLYMISDYIASIKKESLEEESLKNKDTVLQISIVGRPNAGKSTLVNKILNEERVITGPEPGITRDAISINWKYKNRDIKLIDTAGVRKKNTIDNTIEQLSVEETFRAINFSQVVVLLMDIETALEQQDIAIAEMILREGRGIILGFNKCDDKNKEKKYLRHVDDLISFNAPYLAFAPKIILSAKGGYNVDKITEKAFEVYDEWNKRIPTGKLNKWLAEAVEYNPHPMAKNRRDLKFKYCTQAKIRPPYFTIFCNYPEQVKDSYERYLTGSIRKKFGLNNVPMKINLKKSNNPYET